MMTLTEIVEQLRACSYTCDAGKLEDNIAFKELEKIIALSNEIDKDKISLDDIINSEIIKQQLNDDNNESY